MKTGKKQMSATMTIFELMPKPNHTMIRGARATFWHRLKSDDVRINEALEHLGGRDEGAGHERQAAADEIAQDGRLESREEMGPVEALHISDPECLDDGTGSRKNIVWDCEQRN